MNPSPLRAVLLLLSLLPLPVLASTIGYVDMQKVLEQSAIGKRVQEQLRADFEPRGRALAEEEQEIMRAKQSLERDKPLMSQSQISKKEGELKARIDKYQEQAGAMQRDLMQAQKEKGREIIEPARKAVNAVAHEKKLDMVVERGQAGLLYVDDSLDLTDAVIRRLDADAD